MNKILVIPAMAEYQWIFKTLENLRLAAGYPQVKIIVVINNPRDCSEDIYNDNRLTWEKVKSEYPEVQLIDNFSPGKSFSPKKQGVGLARRIGFREGLKDESGPAICFCLDADTLVEEDYFQKVEYQYLHSKFAGVTIDSWHQLPDEFQLREAIVKYELYLRYYYRAMQLTGTPFAFWAIGSSLTFMSTAYLKVGGFPAKKAGEDFYFLQKLRSYGKIEHIYTTRTYPAARLSYRVPFGTGPALEKYMGNKSTFNYLPAPHLFLEIRDWFSCLYLWAKSDFQEPLEFSSVNLKRFLEQWSTLEIIDSCRRNSKTPESFLNRYQHWFNGLRIRQYLNYCGDKIDLDRGIRYFWDLPGNEPEIWLNLIRRKFNRSVN